MKTTKLYRLSGKTVSIVANYGYQKKKGRIDYKSALVAFSDTNYSYLCESLLLMPNYHAVKARILYIIRCVRSTWLGFITL